MNRRRNPYRYGRMRNHFRKAVENKTRPQHQRHHEVRNAYGRYRAGVNKYNREKDRTFRPGKDYIHWCRTCGVPLIQQTCGLCGKAGEKLTLSPPADVRPAMQDGVELVKSLFKREFGTSLFLEGKIILFNKIAGLDRRDQIIVDGRVIGTLSYIPDKRDYHLDVTSDGAMMMGNDSKLYVLLDRDKLPGRHISGKTVNRHAIIAKSPGIKAGSQVVLRVDRQTGIGIALCDLDVLDEISENVPVIRVKDVSFEFGSDVQREASFNSPTWFEVAEANTAGLMTLETRAVDEIRDCFRKRSNKSAGASITVSFSGGKDSLVSLELTCKAMDGVGGIETIFIDTGLEFPETIEYVMKIAMEKGLLLRKISAGDTFWQHIDTFGPPGKDYRWCCKTCKLGPLTELIEKYYKNGTATVEGNRKYESFSRSGITAVSKNPFVPNQVMLNPIRDWRALDVWLYIFWKKLPYNPLYDMDIERIGCWLCPSSLESEFEKMRITHPALHDRWISYLIKWADDNGIDVRCATHGFWRWKKLPPKMIQFANSLGIRNLIPSSVNKSGYPKKPGIAYVRGISPCISGGFSVEAILTFPHDIKSASGNLQHSITLDTVAEFLKMLGDVRVSDEYGTIVVGAGEGANVKYFSGGQISVTARDRKKLETLFRTAVSLISRAYLCAKCGICVVGCRKGAITLNKKNGRIHVNIERCDRCLKCQEGCVAAKFGEKLLASYDRMNRVYDANG